MTGGLGSLSSRAVFPELKSKFLLLSRCGQRTTVMPPSRESLVNRGDEDGTLPALQQ